MTINDKNKLESEVVKIIEKICDIKGLEENSDLNLFSNGFLDSLNTIDLFDEVEETLGICCNYAEYEREQIDTVNKIIKVVKLKLEE